MRFQFFIEAYFMVDTNGWYVSWKRHYFFFFLVVLFQKGGLPFCGAVHTWCTGASAWVSANSVVFTLWVPYTVWLCRIVTPCQTRYWNMSLAARTKQWTARNLKKLCAQRDRYSFLCPNSIVGTWKKGVLTLVLSEYRTWADRAWAPSAVKAAKLIDLLTNYVILGPHTLLSLIIIKILCVFFSLLFSVIQNWKRLFHHVLNIFTWVFWFLL